MASQLTIGIKGAGTRKELADALKMIANSLWSEDMEEIYNIDGASYNDMAVEVELKDPESE
jgi:hypothetical protein